MKYLRKLVLIAVLILAGLSFTHTLDSINQDIGRHLKTGEIIWQTKSVPQTNLFSYTEPATPFINHHWGSEVIFYLLNLSVGLQGLIILKILVLLGAFILLYFAVLSRASPLAYASATVVALILIVDRTDVRPEIFSYLFLACFLFAIFRAKYGGWGRWLYTLPFIELLWANTHIYFPFGVGLIGLFALERLINGNPGWKRVAWVTLACIVATLINPSGLHGALEPFTVLTNYGYTIVENQGILFLKNYGILLTQINWFILITILFIASYIPAVKRYGFKNYLFEFIAGGVFIALGADMIRNLGPYAIVLTPIFALNLSAYGSQKQIPARTHALAYGSALAILVILGWLTVTNTTFRWAGEGTDFGLAVPEGAQDGVNFVLDNHIAGPVFNNFDVGSYLIWKLYPQQQVFVDGRPEAYPASFFSDIYKPMQEDPATWNHYANDVYHINYIFFDYHDITPWAQTFLSFISQDKNWPLVYQDGSVVIFIQRNQQNLPLIQRYAKPISY